MTTQKFDPENNDEHAFSHILMQAYPYDRIITPEELDWAMQWFRKGDILEDKNRIREGWWRDLRALRLIENSRLMRPRLKKVAEYIWSQEGETASFAKLQAWLRPQDEMLQKQVSQKLKAVQKKKKMQRKQRKLSRKRR